MPIRKYSEQIIKEKRILPTNKHVLRASRIPQTAQREARGMATATAAILIHIVFVAPFFRRLLLFLPQAFQYSTIISSNKQQQQCQKLTLPYLVFFF